MIKKTNQQEVVCQTTPHDGAYLECSLPLVCPMFRGIPSTSPMDHHLLQTTSKTIGAFLK